MYMVVVGEVCLIFYMHMYGEDMGQLSVYQMFSSGQTRQLLYNNNGESNLWQRRVIVIPSTSQAYKVCILQLANHIRYASFN